MPDFIETLRKITITPEVYKKLPESPGVYIFLHSESPIYIGKAINLKRRVGSYFDFDLETKTSRMISGATQLSVVKVASELEALLLEAKLIRAYMPKYNVAAKDDKHPLYIQITKEKYPRIITARKISENQKNLAFFGPFPSSRNVKSVLKMLRRIFPYSDHKLGNRGCLYSHIGLCKPCPSEIEKIKNLELRIKQKKEYVRNIRRINSVLLGKFDGVKKELLNEMEKLSRDQNYEEAVLIRDQITKLEYITQPQMPVDYYIQNPNLYEDERNNELKALKKILLRHGIIIPKLERIECFDIAHLAGVSATASMVTFLAAEPAKEFYRHFRIRQKKGQDDIASMTEVIERRLKHLGDWGKPDLIIVDGGKAQTSVFVKQLKSLNIPVVGLAKRFETLVIPTSEGGFTKLSEFKFEKGAALNLVQRIRNEAHRFARRYHHELISISLNENTN